MILSVLENDIICRLQTDLIPSNNRYNEIIYCFKPIYSKKKKTIVESEVRYTKNLTQLYLYTYSRIGIDKSITHIFLKINMITQTGIFLTNVHLLLNICKQTGNKFLQNKSRKTRPLILYKQQYKMKITLFNDSNYPPEIILMDTNANATQNNGSDFTTLYIIF